MTILWWHWLVFGLILMIGEIATPGGFYIIFFGVAAVVVGLLSAIDSAGPEWFQILLFSVLSVMLLLFFRGRLLQWMQINPQRPAVDPLTGEIGTVTEMLPPGAIGKIELRGSSWSARNVSDATLTPGTRCRVMRVEGLTLHVAPEGAR